MTKIIVLILILLSLAACGLASTPYPEPPPSPALTELPPVNWATPTAIIIEPPAPVHDPVILDCDGNLTTTSWLYDYFGAVSWQPPVLENAARLKWLRAACGDAPAVIVAHVERATGGEPIAGVTVIFSWPDAPVLPDELQGCGLARGIYGPTNANGDVGFGLGSGSYYWPPDGGPHTLWVPSGGACVAGIGMVAATAHHHLDITWSLSDVTAVDALPDWGYTPGSLVDVETNTVTWPGMGWEQ